MNQPTAPVPLKLHFSARDTYPAPPLDMLRRLRRLFAYDDWANREVLSTLKAVGAPPLRSLRLMAHIVAAERLWLGRLERDQKPVVVWPELSLRQCEEQAAELPPLWRDFLGGHTEATLAQPVAYVNSKGEGWTSTVEDILTHVLLHSSYHRGQVAADLRAAGHAPPYTDFIHSVRQGLVE